MAKDKSKRRTLENLRLAGVEERQRARDLEVSAQAATNDAEIAREQLIEAHAAGDARAIKAADNARQAAVRHAENASIQAEAARRRVERAAKEHQRYEAANARHLIDELEPAARLVVERLQSAAAELAAADAEWSSLAQRVNELVAVCPGASPRFDTPIGHALQEVARELRRADGQVVSPLPHWKGLHQHQEQQRVATEQREGQAA
jgi:hypothetical protein